MQYSNSGSSQQAMFNHIEKWQQSKLTQKDYCIQNKIKLAAFHYWLRKYRQQRPKQPEGFFPIQVDSATNNTRAIQIRYPNGVEVELPVQTDLQILQSLISIPG
jgi:hypothetical protein